MFEYNGVFNNHKRNHSLIDFHTPYQVITQIKKFLLAFMLLK
jgi:hypothetical protein